MRFLGDLRADQGSWFLALAAYNGGPNRVRRVVRQYGRGAEPSDSLFWALRRHFPRETQEFVPKLVGAYLVASRPGAYGMVPAESAGPFVFDEVTVPDATTLDVVARAAEVPLDEIERLNPRFVRGMTPPGRPSGLRVPSGNGPTFERNYAEIPPSERVTFVEHRIEAGETLSHIARRYGVLVADLNAANPGLRPRYLRVGAVLTVPVAPSVRSTSAGG
jgi:membrane-bound lytic murein transglycosylase D